jgi:peptidoglycan/LPS O-acetylase OafA/YrhL
MTTRAAMDRMDHFTSGRDGLAAAGRIGSAPAARYHALDALRGIMMLLGIYLHVACAYGTIGGWPFKQPEQTGALNLTVVLIHVFRMPVFYVMAGFFAALLYERRGFRAAAVNRIGRIVVPFVVGWAIIFPLSMFLAGWGRFGLERTLAGFASGRVLSYAGPLHLWFLEYLIVFYALAVIAVPALGALPAGWRATFDRAFRRVIDSSWAPLVLAIPSFFALLPMQNPGFDDPPGFVPAPHIAIAYAIPFAVGWLLYRHADLLEVVRRRAWIHAAWALVWTGAFITLVALYFLGLLGGLVHTTGLFLASRAIHSVALWSLILAFIGLFLRYLDRPSASLRYLCDSSYFLYLAHMPVMIAFQLTLLPLAWPPLVKAALVLVATVAVLLALYRYLVRPSFIGAALNGRRYPRTPRVTLAAAT